MFHKNFFTFKAENNFQLGKMMGKQFKEKANEVILPYMSTPEWKTRVEKGQLLLNIANRYFPHYIEETKGYAEGADVDFSDFWTISLEDEIDQQNHCTTVITNNGKLISHNEDWEKDSEDLVSIVLKQVGDLKIFEIYYVNTLGGTSISINSNGFVSSVNSMVHSDAQIGVPYHVFARFISETDDPENDFQKLQHIPRSSGLNFNLANQKGVVWNIELTATKAKLTKPTVPFVHTNHYLTELKTFEKNDNSSGTRERFEAASARVKISMSDDEMVQLTNYASKGNILSVMNERTIAKMIVNLENLSASIWLRRENEQGWVRYNLKELLEL